tara:strand:- start:54 stop:758 length:705 start_codon:yes stop_codon:yes gene_type:complete
MSLHEFKLIDGKPSPSIGPIKAIILGFKNYANFSGRSSRKEFWYWMLFIGIGHFIVSLEYALYGVIDVITGFYYGDYMYDAVLELLEYSFLMGWLVEWLVFPITQTFLLATAVPTLAVINRRLHDTGLSGRYQILWYLLNLIVSLFTGALMYFSGLFFTLQEALMYVLRGSLLVFIKPTIFIDFVQNLLLITSGGTVQEQDLNYLILGLVPLVLSVWLVVIAIRNSEKGTNRYG